MRLKEDEKENKVDYITHCTLIAIDSGTFCEGFSSPSIGSKEISLHLPRKEKASNDTQECLDEYDKLHSGEENICML